MAKYAVLMAGVCVLMVFSGCYNASEPLVVIGGREDAKPRSSVKDPAPGVPDSELSNPQRLQRELSVCQENLKIRDKKIDRLEEQLGDMRDEHKKERKDYEKTIKGLEDRIQELERENRSLRRKHGD